MVMDSDEFIFGPYKDWEDVPRILERELAAGTEVIQTYGMNIVGQPGHDGVPDAAAHPGKQLWELIPHGVAAPVYSKPVVVRPETKLSWSRGRHKIEAIRTLISYGPLLKLLHFRYLGPNYTAQRNARNLARCGLKNGDKNAAWSCSPERQDKTMEGCPQWASYQQTLSCDVINIPI
jgi:hypothetical protein